ncbi:nucleotide kinase domain-containing protein [Crocinitomix algicola]|uniref:nucleotide kinase domain-containing protein n=1 Tax=Crocinitomix algicola TaxID=1740263 RepID=UPI0008733A2E|nr:nucleotide kinase domain-containing protein [Crocinitomix algicola]
MKFTNLKDNLLPFDIIDKETLSEIKFFFHQINNQALFKLGIKNSYNDHGVVALSLSTEYFPLFITYDDRTRYIAENIVLSDIDIENIVCNTIISHFYGARGIHQIATKEGNPKNALIDFKRLLVDQKYKDWINENLNDARRKGNHIYGRTELRTSLLEAANTFVSIKEGKKRNLYPINIMLWVASFIESGLIYKIINAQSLQELYKNVSSTKGVGQYYGYHCAISNSINPKINVNHDEPFCVPGPGAKKVLQLLFPNISPREFNYGDRVVWLRHHQKELFGEFEVDESMHNIIVNEKRIFKDDQNDLKVYGLEVGLCQFGVYQRLRDNPKLVSNRKIVRLKTL